MPVMKMIFINTLHLVPRLFIAVMQRPLVVLGRDGRPCWCLSDRTEGEGLPAEPSDCVSGRPEPVADFRLSHCCCCFVFISATHDMHYATRPLALDLVPYLSGGGWSPGAGLQLQISLK